jgi:hypothetical protein
MCAKRQDRTFSHHGPREVVTLDWILHSLLCLPIRDRDKNNTHNKHISDKHTLMTVCVRNSTPFDGVHAPQSLRFGLVLRSGLVGSYTAPCVSPFAIATSIKINKKSLTPGWVVYGKRRHAEPPEEDVPPQLYP